MLIWSARVPSTRARSYLVMNFVVTLSLFSLLCVGVSPPSPTSIISTLPSLRASASTMSSSYLCSASKQARERKERKEKERRRRRRKSKQRSVYLGGFNFRSLEALFLNTRNCCTQDNCSRSFLKETGEGNSCKLLSCKLTRPSERLPRSPSSLSLSSLSLSSLSLSISLLSRAPL